jgi:hypothetical protein
MSSNHMLEEDKDLHMTKSNEALYDWLFHYCSYENEWRAFHRSEYQAYWNGECKSLIFSKNIEELKRLIINNGELLQKDSDME